MSFEQRVEQHHVLQYGTNAKQAVQQTRTYLRSYVTEQPCEGEASEAVKLYDERSGKREDGRVPTIRDNPTNRRRRWLIYEDPYYDGEFITSTDMWRQSMDPTSRLQKAIASGANRFLDDVIIGGIMNTAYEGKRPSNAKTLGAENTVDVAVGGADSGLNVEKMISAIDIFGGFEVYDANGGQNSETPMARPKLAVTSKQMVDLLNTPAIQNRDTGGVDRAVLRRGWVDDFLGFDICMINRLPTKPDDPTVRYNPVWFPDNIVLGVWHDFDPRLFNVANNWETPYAGIVCNFSAVRLEEKKVVRIECKETTTT